MENHKLFTDRLTDFDFSPAVRDMVEGDFSLHSYNLDQLKDSFGDRIFTIGLFELVLSILHIGIKENIAVKRIDITGLGGTESGYKDRNEIRTLATLLLSLFKEIGVKRCSEKDVYNYIYLVARKNTYNPVIDMFEEDRATDHNIERLCQILGIADRSNEKAYLSMCLCQAVALQYNCRRDSPVAADFILVLLGSQGIGKTSFLRKLAIRSDWFTEGASINMDSKDSLMNAVGRPFCELGEFDSTTKKKQTSLKAFITQTIDSYREPYDKSISSWPRMTSFFATVNDPEFLHDLTGSRRYLVINLDRIDKDALFNLSEEFFKGVWKEAWLMYMADPNCWRMGDDLISLTMKNNEEYRQKAKYESEIEDSLDWDQDCERWREMSATELKVELNYYNVLPQTSDSVSVGRAIKAIMKRRPEIRSFKRRNQNTYLLPSVKRDIMARRAR